MDDPLLLSGPITPHSQLTSIIKKRLRDYTTGPYSQAIEALLSEVYNPDLISQLSKPIDPETNPESQIHEMYNDVARLVTHGIHAFTYGHKRTGAIPILSGLTTPINRSAELSTPNESTPITSSVASLTSDTCTPRSKTAAKHCLTQDRRCIVTGRTRPDFPLDVAHIIPYRISQSPNSREGHFWKLLELFMGLNLTNALWEYVGHEKVNRLENLIVLDSGIHNMFDMGSISLLPILPLPKDSRFEYTIKLTWQGKIKMIPGLISTCHPPKEHLNKVTLDEARPVTDPDMFLLKTSDPENYPLPNPRLLLIYQALVRLRKLVANGEMPDAGWYLPDDGMPACVLTDAGGFDMLSRKLLQAIGSTTGEEEDTSSKQSCFWGDNRALEIYEDRGAGNGFDHYSI